MTIQQQLMNQIHTVREVLTIITPLKRVSANCHPMIKSIAKRDHVKPCYREGKCNYYDADYFRGVLTRELAKLQTKIQSERYWLSVQIERLQDEIEQLREQLAILSD